MEKKDFDLAYRRFSDAYFYDGQETPAPSGAERYCSYDYCEVLNGLTFRVPMVGLGLGNDLRELVNCINRWKHSLGQWDVWNGVLEGYNEDDAWDLRSEFVESITYFCMFQPSGMKDRFVRYITTLLHHANMALDVSYLDRLAEDDKVYKNLENKKSRPYDVFLPKKELLEQVEKLAQNWSAAAVLLSTLVALDDDGYRDVTADFRNKASHSIAPHFEFGQTNMVTRQVGFADRQVDLGDGQIGFVEDRTRKSVPYGFGGVLPLSLKDTYAENKKQYDIARQAWSACENLLKEVCEKLKAR